jgi:N-acetylmuramoyl-L-alanine amidase
VSLHILDTPENGFIVQVPKMITIHCADSRNGKPYPLEQMRHDHLLRGFKDIAYHKIIQPNGEVQDGRPLNIEGSHVSQHNKGNIGICLVGNTLFTQAQWNALRNTLDGIFLTYSIPKTELHCHYQFDTAIKQGKTCPNVPINVILLWYYETVGEQAIAPYLLKE